MTAKLNHTIVAARERDASALFLSEIRRLDPPLILGPFALATVRDELTLDFLETDEQTMAQHYAFLVSAYRTNREQINHWDDGRGVYFEDPNGHRLETLTRSCGSAGTKVESPHPVVAEKLPRKAEAGERHASNSTGKRDCVTRG